MISSLMDDSLVLEIFILSPDQRIVAQPTATVPKCFITVFLLLMIFKLQVSERIC